MSASHNYFQWGGEPPIDTIADLWAQFWTVDQHRLGHSLICSFERGDGYKKTREDLLTYMSGNGEWVPRYGALRSSPEFWAWTSPTSRDSHSHFLIKEFVDYNELRFYQDDDTKTSREVAAQHLRRLRSKLQGISPALLDLPDAPAQQYSPLDRVFCPYGFEDLDSDEDEDDENDLDFHLMLEDQEQVLSDLREQVTFWQSEAKSGPPDDSSVAVHGSPHMSIDPRKLGFTVPSCIAFLGSTSPSVQQLKDAITLVVNDLHGYKNSVPSPVAFEFTHDGNLVEFAFGGLLFQSFRKYSWKLAYMLLLNQWLPESEAAAREAENVAVVIPTPAIKLVNPDYDGFARDVLAFLSRRDEMHPWAYNPMAVFFLMSQHARRVPGIRVASMTGSWLSLVVPQKQQRADLTADTTPVPVNRDALFSVENLDRRLHCIVMETLWQRSALKRLRGLLHSGPHRAQSTAAPTTKPSSASTSAPTASTGKRFRAASAGSAFEQPKPKKARSEGRGRASRTKNAARRGPQQKDQSKMEQQAERHAQTQCSQSLTVDDWDDAEEPPRDRLPSWWTDRSCSECEGRGLEPDAWCVQVVEVIRNPNASAYDGFALTHAEGDNRLKPRELTTLKEHCGKEDFNFAYVEWGVAVHTTTNALWLFDGQDYHGTIMPSVAAMNQGAVSQGKHGSENERNVGRARAGRRARTNCGRRRAAELA
ncbi:hypothetical protein HMN09_00611800 [Mycena chlorophos]|uniref:Uncharacterized protein n=1 Tax=Mycena chlorophos TaxID=658473 RepID=A0A8H6WFN4_MYCCL|nr:hypothetical protein HMN09_00611800 [Mycena chlorophos]